MRLRPTTCRLCAPMGTMQGAPTGEPSPFHEVSHGASRNLPLLTAHRTRHGWCCLAGIIPANGRMEWPLQPNAGKRTTVTPAQPTKRSTGDAVPHAVGSGEVARVANATPHLNPESVGAPLDDVPVHGFVPSIVYLGGQAGLRFVLCTGPGLRTHDGECAPLVGRPRRQARPRRTTGAGMQPTPRGR